MHLRIASLLASLLVLSTSALAQLTETQAPPPSAAEANAARLALEKNALSLLDEVVEEAEGLKLLENRVRVYAVAAGLVWARDPATARTMFAKAAEGIATMTAEIDLADPQIYNRRQTIQQLRQQLIEMSARHDAKLALEFLRASRQPSTFAYPNADYQPPDQEQALEMTLASLIAAQDPKQAYAMAEESLRKRVTQNLVSVVQQIASKDHELAVRLVGEIVKRLRPAELVRDYESAGVAMSLLSLTRTPPAPENSPQPVFIGSMRSNSFVVNGNIIIDEMTRRRLLEVIVSASLMDVAPRFSGHVQNMIYNLREAQAEIEKYAPLQAAGIKKRVNELQSRNDPRSNAWNEYQQVMSNGSIDSLLEAAQKAPPEIRDQLYQSAAWKASAENNVERARQIAENMVNPERRAQFIRDLDRHIRMQSALQGNAHDVREMIARMATVEEKVQALMQLANTALSKKDKATARDYMEEARLMVSRPRTSSEFHSLISVANQLAQLDDNASFEIIESSVGRLNELIDAAEVLDGFGQQAFTDGELRQTAGYMWNELIGRCASELAALARKDFARARLIARKFQRLDARTSAQLMLARDVLQNLGSENTQITNLPVNIPPRIRRGM